MSGFGGGIRVLLFCRWTVLRLGQFHGGRGRGQLGFRWRGACIVGGFWTLWLLVRGTYEGNLLFWWAGVGSFLMMCAFAALRRMVFLGMVVGVLACWGALR